MLPQFRKWNLMCRARGILGLLVNARGTLRSSDPSSIISSPYSSTQKRKSISSSASKAFSSSATDRVPCVCIVGSGPAGFYTAQQILKVDQDLDPYAGTFLTFTTVLYFTGNLYSKLTPDLQFSLYFLLSLFFTLYAEPPQCSCGHV